MLCRRPTTPLSRPLGAWTRLAPARPARRWLRPLTPGMLHGQGQAPSDVSDALVKRAQGVCEPARLHIDRKQYRRDGNRSDLLASADAGAAQPLMTNCNLRLTCMLFERNPNQRKRKGNARNIHRSSPGTPSATAADSGSAQAQQRQRGSPASPQPAEAVPGACCAVTTLLYAACISTAPAVQLVLDMTPWWSMAASMTPISPYGRSVCAPSPVMTSESEGAHVMRQRNGPLLTDGALCGRSQMRFRSGTACSGRTLRRP